MKWKNWIFLAAFFLFPLGAEVIVSADAPPVQKRAAEELTGYLKKILGDKSRIPAIYLGEGFARRAGIDLSGLGNEGFVIARRGKSYYISPESRSGRGILYGVYEFLERQGCRFWTEDEEDIPRKTHLNLPDKEDWRSVPAFPLYRWIISGTCSQKWIMTGKLKLNGGSFGFVPEPRDGIVSYQAPHNSHTHFKFMPAGKYGRTNPEFFALQKNGKRLADDRKGQLCLTNPDMIREYIANVRKYLKENYKEGMILVLVQSDNYASCQCVSCLESDRRYGNSPSGTYLNFINTVARDLYRDYPKLMMRMSAYQYTRKPPQGITPEKNVIISLSNIECDFSKKLTDSPENLKFLREQEAWSRIAHTLFVGNYGTSFDAYLYPFPNFDSLGDRYRHGKKHNARGASMLSAHANAFAEFGHLRDYLTAKLLWDPESDAWEIAGEFCKGYYGPDAGKILLEYLKFYHRYFAERNQKFRFALYDRTYYYGCLIPEFLAYAGTYYDRAVSAASGNPVWLRRVREAQLSIRYMELEAHRAWIPGSPVWKVRFEAFLRDARKAGCFAIGEMKEHLLSAWEEKIRKTRIPADIAAIRPDQERETVVLPLRLLKRGKWYSVVSDPLAANGSAYRLHTDHDQWAIQGVLRPLARYSSGKWNIYARIRVDYISGLADKTPLFQYGASGTGSKAPHNLARKKQFEPGRYYYVPLAENIRPAEKSYVWIAPLKNVSRVPGVYVDCIIGVASGK